jgi:hypothetical protein
MPKYLQIKGIVPIQIKNNKYTEVFSSYVSKDFLVIDYDLRAQRLSKINEIQVGKMVSRIIYTWVSRGTHR